jgi:hypothetical protein
MILLLYNIYPCLLGVCLLTESLETVVINDFEAETGT